MYIKYDYHSSVSCNNRIVFQKARCIPSQNHNLETGRNWAVILIYTVHFLRTFVVIFVGIVMYCNLNLTFLKLLRLTCDVDIESTVANSCILASIPFGRNTG